MDEPLNLVLFSGTDDKLQAAAVLTRRRRRARPARQRLPPVLGARRVPGRPDRRATTGSPRRPARRAGARSTTCRAAGQAELGRDASPGQGARRRRHRGVLAVDGPARDLEPADLDPLVDGVEGVTAFYLNAGEGQVVFI